MASKSAQSSKRRQHTISPYYYFCMEFVDDCLKNGRQFRIAKQGFEAAALKWNALTTAEKDQFRETFRAERKKCADEGNSKMKMSNGDRGDVNCDPTMLGIVKDLSLKKAKDVKELTGRWMWAFSEKKGVRNEHFLILSAKSDRLFTAEGFTELAIVEFTLEKGLIDEFSVDLARAKFGNSAMLRYDAIRRVLEWPSRFNRELGGTAPIYFAAPGQMAAVFDALTFTDVFYPVESLENPKSQISLDRDLANLDDLADALRDWYKTSKPNGNEETDRRTDDGGQCCSATVRQCVARILNQFAAL